MAQPRSADPQASPCVCATLRATTRAISRVYDESLAPAGLRTTHYSILAWLRSEGPIPLGRLAAVLGMDRTTLSRELRPLVERGLVDVTSGADRRQRLLDLSATGRDRLRAARPLWQQAQVRVDDTFGAERARSLLGELRALTAAAARTGD
jgi:DNA-binding MarR family transcriptional regulator